MTAVGNHAAKAVSRDDVGYSKNACNKGNQRRMDTDIRPAFATPDPNSGDRNATLTQKYVGEITGQFVVASYQRGYRWQEPEVEALLNDIWESGGKRDKTGGERYSLQPVVVKAMGDGKHELIDGQQRLTTLFLIYRLMRCEGFTDTEPPYQITYETRKESQGFLASPDSGDAEKNIDFYHMHKAYECIGRWFRAEPCDLQSRATKLLGYLRDWVSVIWYEAPASAFGEEARKDAITLFTRLNAGRIPLTNAELVKALLLTNLGSKDSRRTGQTTLAAAKPHAGQTDQTMLVAAEWDRIERDLRRPDVWAFVSKRKPEDCPTRIDLLLDTLADLEPSDPGAARGTGDRFWTFKTLQRRFGDKPAALWEKVVELHAFVLGWFEDRDIFHKIGFLVAHEVTFGDLVRLAQSCGKNEFKTHLGNRIKQKLALSEGDVKELSYESPNDCQRALLLMNVETVRRMEHSSERFPFHSYHASQWSLEHIHAQNTQGLTRFEQWKSWLEEHRDALMIFDASGNQKQDAAREVQDDIGSFLKSPPEKLGDRFHELARRVIELLNAPNEDGTQTALMDDEHAISNLALLRKDSNSVLGNAVFEVKRRKVLKLDKEGVFVPIATKYVFLKYYADADALQPHFWSQRDREAYRAAMLDVLGPYLKEQPQ